MGSGTYPLPILVKRMEKVYTIEDYQKGISGETRPEDASEVREALLPITNLIDPLDWTLVFPKQAPIELDLGCGDGGFLVEYALLHPEHNFLGVERLMGRINKIIRKRERLGLENIKVSRIESAYFLKYLVKPGSLHAIHLYFPDPWPKRRHEKYRLVQADFVRSCRKSLSPEGAVYLRTDHPEYFEQMREAFAAEPALVPIQTPEELSSVQTDFEKQWLAQGLKTHYAAYGKIQPGTN